MLRRIITITLIGIIASSTVIGAQNLFENDFWWQAVEVRRQAESALDAGEYESSIELSQQAQLLYQMARVQALALFEAFRARAYKVRTEGVIDEIDKRGTLSRELAAVLEDARAYYREGVLLFDEGSYTVSSLSFQDALATLEFADLIGPGAVAALEAALPQYYRVRLIPGDRDSFSKIAGYDFVYGDISEWQRLYEANKDKIADSENPNLIHPGQYFVIPPLGDEARAGEWEADDDRSESGE